MPVTTSNQHRSQTVVVHIGSAAITEADYDHWMAIGAATVARPKPTGPIPEPTVYAPPSFTACIARLRSTGSHSPTAALGEQCKMTYERIQARILNFLISGYWLRGQAAESGIAVSPGEVHRRFEEERRAHYTTASFRRLRETSRQTITDLEFAVETQMLSAKLLEAFVKAHPQDKSERSAIAHFNSSIRNEWVPKTSCLRGYVVPDCKQYKSVS